MRNKRVSFFPFLLGGTDCLFPLSSSVALSYSPHGTFYLLLMIPADHFSGSSHLEFVVSHLPNRSPASVSRCDERRLPLVTLSRLLRGLSATRRARQARTKSSSRGRTWLVLRVHLLCQTRRTSSVLCCTPGAASGPTVSLFPLGAPPLPRSRSQLVPLRPSECPCLHSTTGNKSTMSSPLSEIEGPQILEGQGSTFILGAFAGFTSNKIGRLVTENGGYVLPLSSAFLSCGRGGSGADGAAV